MRIVDEEEGVFGGAGAGAFKKENGLSSLHANSEDGAARRGGVLSTWSCSGSTDIEVHRRIALDGLRRCWGTANDRRRELGEEDDDLDELGGEVDVGGAVCIDVMGVMGGMAVESGVAQCCATSRNGL